MLAPEASFGAPRRPPHAVTRTGHPRAYRVCRHGLVVVGSSDCPDYHAHARWYFNVGPGAATALETIFDLRIEAHELPTTFALIATRDTTPVKVSVRYRG
jgi:hypothetical protein